MKTFARGFRRGIRHAAAVLAAGLIVAGAAEARAQGNFGTIKGRLVWSGEGIPAEVVLQKVGKADKDPTVCALNQPILSKELVVDPATKGVRYGFAYLPKPTGANPDAVKALVAKTPAVEIDQNNCEFLPYVTAMNQEQSLVLKSSDATNHNVRYSAFTNAPFNQILPPKGQVSLKLVAERRPMQLKCDIHPWMTGYVMVFDHPFFATTGVDGSFEIQGVPAGEQKLVVWQEKKGYVTEGKGAGIPVMVKAGGVTDVGEIMLKLP